MQGHQVHLHQELGRISPNGDQPQELTMKAIAVIPGRANSIHLREVPKPQLEQIPGGRGVLVRLTRVGVDGTDKEINAAAYGAPPPGDEYLILGHENLGCVEAVGPAVDEFQPGDYVVASVRRPGKSLYDKIGLQDMTTDDTYFERGINLLHGYLAEYYSDSADYLVRVPKGLSKVGVLLEPSSVVEKAIGQAFEVQRRLRVWRPRRAAVLGAGTLGLHEPPYLNAQLLDEIGVRYISTKRMSLKEASARFGPFELILEGIGFSPLVFQAMEVLAKNGVLAMVSITGQDRTMDVPTDRINLGYVLGNKVCLGSVNASRDDFEQAVLGLSAAELSFPGWLEKLLTHPVKGLDNYAELIEKLTNAKGAIKVFCEVSGDMT